MTGSIDKVDREDGQVLKLKAEEGLLVELVADDGENSVDSGGDGDTLLENEVPETKIPVTMFLLLLLLLFFIHGRMDDAEKRVQLTSGDGLVMLVTISAAREAPGVAYCRC